MNKLEILFKEVVSRKNPFIIFFPFLMLFIGYVITYHSDTLVGDEGGYIFFAGNLLKGFYSPAAPDINLWWGPGFPIILTPFLFLNLPMIFISLMNAVLQYLSIVFLHKALIQVSRFREAFFFSLIWAFCYSSYPFIPMILTEPFTAFLISVLIYELVGAFNGNKKKIYLAGFIIGYLALTKVIFGYVIMAMILGNIFLYLLNRKSSNYKKSIVILLIAFATTVPYLLYTYNLTGKIFYWGNSGGMSLYWMSTPFENEYGEWNNETFVPESVGTVNPEKTTLLKANHQKEIEEVQKYKGVEKDDAYKKIALSNIKNHPTKYFKNVIANISRSFFGFPQSFTYQQILMKVWYFSVLFALIIFSLVLSLVNWKSITYSIRFLLIFIFIYFAGSSLVSIDNRQLVVIVPVFLFWIGYIIHHSIKIKIKFV